MEARAKLFGHPIQQMLIVDLIAVSTDRPALLQASLSGPAR